MCLSFLNFQDRDLPFKKGSSDSMPFPPGVGGGRGVGDANINAQSYEVITADKAIDESNVGNRMLRNMGWQEGLVYFPSSHRKFLILIFILLVQRMCSVKTFFFFRLFLDCLYYYYKLCLLHFLFLLSTGITYSHVSKWHIFYS